MSAQAVCMPINTSSFAMDTSGMTAEQSGAYMFLLIDCWIKGSLPNDEVRLAKIIGVTRTYFVRRIWPDIQFLFVLSGDTLTSERIDAARRRTPDGSAAARRDPVPGWPALRLSVFQRDSFTCQYCGEVDVELECDHVHPLSRGGSSHLDNLATACRPCNRSKSDLLLSEWVQA
jgi:uncharacterized protein YdaU (DUF1376 family)